jgi:hypothetical protein
MTTLCDIVAQHQSLFYRQDWWHWEGFADRSLGTLPPMPDEFRPLRAFPVAGGNWYDDDWGLIGDLPYAVTYAALYVAHPKAPIWSKYLWTGDTDHLGQRVYVGGVCPENGMRFEIHRHLAITDKWGIAVWA